jgi:DNA repair photolyase
MKFGETTCKSILNKSGISGVDYAINPYIGCTHGCVYCYARFMTKWYHQGEEWGTFVDVKKNAVECFYKEAPRKTRGIVLLSSVTDPYQPVERKEKITRDILIGLNEFIFPVQILTKSSLVTRDIDIISELIEVEVGLTITGYDEKIRKIFEPYASPIEKRIEALEEYNDLGIATYAFLGPLLPYLTEKDLNKLLNSLSDKVGRIIVDRLNIKAGNWKTIRNAVKDNYPDLLPKFKEASQGKSLYYDFLKENVKKMIDKRAIHSDIIF